MPAWYSGQSGRPHGDPRVVDYQTGFVKALAGSLAASTRVGLLQPLHGKAGSADVGGWSIRPGAGGEGHPVHGQRVGHGRGLQVHIETAIKVLRARTVNQPAACPVSLKQP